MRFRVVVIGGGLAGLFTAVELVDAGVEDVVVLDREHAPGGVARTIRRNGFELEPAAGTLLLPHPHLSPLLDRLGVDMRPAAAATGTRYVWTGGRLVPIPASPAALLAPLVPWPAKLRAIGEAVVRSRPAGADESLDGFMRRRFGRAGAALAWLAASGVYAGDPAALSARAAFPRLVELEDEAGSVIRGGLRRLRSRPAGAPRPAAHVPVGGMAAVAAAAASRLGDRYVGGVAVGAVGGDGQGWRIEADQAYTADHVVLACGPKAVAGMVGGELGDLLRRAAAAPVVVLGLGGPEGALRLPAGFGALTARDAGTAARGVLFESSYAPERVPAGQALLKVIAGGAARPEIVEWDDDRIVEAVGGEAARIAGSDPAWTFTEVVRHVPGIPQYELGHRAWLGEVERRLGPGLHLTGWGYRGVGVANVAADAARTAAAIAG